jgi:hypothetical protein
LLITINQVNFEKAPKGYMVANVSYLKDGEPKSTKILSFAAPNVYATLEGYKNFPVDVNVVVKKEGNYWNWKDIESPGAKSNGTNPSTSKPASGKVIGSNYETSEERAKRQVYIVRQSSISSAIELLKAQSPKGVEAKVQDVIEVAKEIEAFVLSTEKPIEVPE